jgi:hypothetical protein
MYSPPFAGRGSQTTLTDFGCATSRMRRKEQHVAPSEPHVVMCVIRLRFLHRQTDFPLALMPHSLP